MSSTRINFNKRNIERKLQKIIEEKSMNLIYTDVGSVNNMLNGNEEELLDILISKYKDKYEIMISHNDYPDYMRLSIKNYLNKLKLSGLISHYSVYITEGCYIVLTPEAFQYYNKKGRRKELFNELSTSDKNFLKEIIEEDKKNNDIVEFLKMKLEKDSDDTIREMIGLLKSNGLINVLWADDTIYEAKLTNNGRTFFEREKSYREEIKQNSTYINAQNSNIFMGNIVNSTININNALDNINDDIESKCNSDEEKNELKELLEEAKEIIENYNQSNCLTKRSSFYKKLISHFDSHGWFYAEIVNLFGQFVLTKISGQ
ncbi:MAG: hypothetical protein IJ097_05250 [Bacilli bacterium]|nr:hypothetical protein [Bacilli bacterium]